jgi:hypothetical protein
MALFMWNVIRRLKCVGGNTKTAEQGNADAEDFLIELEILESEICG